MVLGQQSGFTKNPCFLCFWNSRNRKNYYIHKRWSTRISFKLSSQNIELTPLVSLDRVLLLHLHIKLGLMKQFVEALNKQGKCFEYLQQKFWNISDAEVHKGVLMTHKSEKCWTFRISSKLRPKKKKLRGRVWKMW